MFAGVDFEATEKVRELCLPYPPSSPAIALFKNGDLIHFVERHHIEGRDALMISGIKAFNSFYKFANKMSPLGNASADECANYCVFLFSDYSRKITMQNLFHDGGFSNTGISEEIIEKFD